MIRSTARVALAVALLLALGVGACGEDPTGGEPATPGDMIATLSAPAGVSASVLLEVASGTVTSAVSDDPDLLVRRVDGTPVRIVAFRGTPGVIAFRIHTDDVTRPPEIRVIEVGGADDALRPGTGGYAVSLVRGAGS